VNRLGNTYVTETDSSLGVMVATVVESRLSGILAEVPSAVILAKLNEYFEDTGITFRVSSTAVQLPNAQQLKTIKKLVADFDPLPEEDDPQSSTAAVWTKGAVNFIKLIRKTGKTVMNERVSKIRAIDKYFRSLTPALPPAPPLLLPPPPAPQDPQGEHPPLDRVAYIALLTVFKTNWENKTNDDLIVNTLYRLFKQLEDAPNTTSVRKIRSYLLSTPNPNPFSCIERFNFIHEPPTPRMTLASIMLTATILLYEPKAEKNTWGNCK
jgi:hypothetical protein